MKRLILLSGIIAIAWVGAIALPLARQAKPEQAAAPSVESLMGTALHQEEVQGRFADAIATYRKVLAAPGVTREQKARAQFRIGACYERLGTGEARKAYEAVLRDYGDLGELAKQAKARLTFLGTPQAAFSVAQEPTPRRVFFDKEPYSYPTISRDGRFLMLVDGGIQDLETGVIRKWAAGTKNESCSGFAGGYEWSPDGTKLAGSCMVGEGRGLFIVAVSDGATTMVEQYTDRLLKVHDWSPDGSQLLLDVIHKTPSRPSEIGVYDVARKAYRTVVHSSRNGTQYAYARSLRFSRDGRFIAYDLPKASDVGDRDIWVVPAAGGEPVAVVSNRSTDELVDWAWDDTGLVFVSDRNDRAGIWFVPLAGGEASGPPMVIKGDAGDIAAFASRVTRRGVFYSTGSGARTVRMATIDMESGKVLEAAKVPGKVAGAEQDSPVWSPDGRSLAYLSYRIGEKAGTGVRTCSIFEPATGQTRHLPLPFYAIPTYGVTWLADSRWVVVNAQRPEDRTPTTAAAQVLRLMKVNVQTAETAEITVCRNYCTVSADGKTIFDYTRASFSRRDLASGETRELYRAREDSSGLFPAFLSPDGQWLAFTESTKAPENRRALKVISTEGGSAREIFSPEPPAGIYVAIGWSSDSHHILFNSHDTAWQVAIEKGSKPIRIDLGFSWLGRFTMHPDGRRVAFFTQEDRPTESWLLENFLPKASVKKGTK